MRRAFLLMAAFFILCGTAQATPVVAVIDGDTVRLASGEQVRLTGIQAPKRALGRANFTDWPLADAAKAHLETLVLNREVRLEQPGAAMDRHGRLLAHLYVGDIWVQGAMVSAGLARAYSFADNRAHAAALLALESEARKARRGIWAHPFYTVRAAADPTALDRLVGTFQIIEGMVCSAAETRANVYVNFGPDWKTDTTLRIDKPDWPLFEDAGWSVHTLPGTRVRLRGWVDRYNGPMVDMDHPERLERLDPLDPPDGEGTPCS